MPSDPAASKIIPFDWLPSNCYQERWRLDLRLCVKKPDAADKQTKGKMVWYHSELSPWKPAGAVVILAGIMGLINSVITIIQ